MTKEQTNEEINGKEMPLVSTFSLQDLIDEAVSQEKEKMIEEIKNADLYDSWVMQDNHTRRTVDYAREQIINLLQNK